MFQKSVYRELKKHHSMSPQFDYLLESFTRYLETLNYSPVSVKNAGAFLHEFFT